MATLSNSNFDPASIGATPVQSSAPTATGDFDPTSIGATPVQAPAPSGGFLSNLSTGVAKGELATAKTLGTIGQFIGNQTGGRVANLIEGNGFTPTTGPLIKNVSPDLFTPGSNASNTADQFLTPQGTAQSIGYGTEKGAELMTPTGLEGDAAKLGAQALPLAPKAGAFVARSIAAGIDQGGKTLLGGGTTGQAEGTGLLGVISPTLGILGGLAKSAAGATGEKIINTLIKPLKSTYAYGHDPARGILAEGITGNSFDSFAENLRARLQSVGQSISQLGQTVTQKGITSDFSGVTKPIDDAMNEAAKNNNPSLMQSLYNVKVALTHTLQMTGGDTEAPSIVAAGQRDLTNLNYQDGKQLLDDITAHTRFTGNPSDDKALNTATQQAYGIAREKLNGMAAQASPELGAQIKNLNQRYGDLSAAQTAVQSRDVVQKRNNIFSLSAKIGLGTSVAGTLGYALVTGDYGTAAKLLGAEIGTGIAMKGADSVAVQTRVAKFLNALGPADRSGIMNSNPMLRTLYQRFTGDFSGAPKPPVAPEKPNIAGLLGAGPEPVIPMNGRPDDSGMVQSSRIGPTPQFNPRLALPPGIPGQINGPTIPLLAPYSAEKGVPWPMPQNPQ